VRFNLAGTAPEKGSTLSHHTTSGEAEQAEPQRTTPHTTVTFSPGDIYSKWGFADGDLLADLLTEWAESRGMSLDEGGDWRYLDHKVLLYVAYQELVEKPGWEPVVFVHTSHNPVRAESDWEGSEPGSPEPNEESEPVEVSVEQIYALADRLFPPRSRSWLRLHHAAHDLWAYSGPDQLHFPLPDDELRSRLFGPAVDHIVERYGLSDEESAVVAMLLQSWRDGRSDRWETPPISVLRDAVATARAILA
jgi:hypothetical protein